MPPFWQFLPVSLECLLTFGTLPMVLQELTGDRPSRRPGGGQCPPSSYDWDRTMGQANAVSVLCGAAPEPLSHRERYPDPHKLHLGVFMSQC